jgi:EAL domain-containing protein (putative c-di-GMP-specific phosphodiesterase class I)
VADIPNNLDAAAIARAIVGLGQTLNRTVIAEGVETAAQSDYLCGIGCGEAQGYYFSRPVSAPEFARWVTDAALPPRSYQQLH